jgi:hypothetical protein
VALGRDGQITLMDFDPSTREVAKLQLAWGAPDFTAPGILRACGKGEAGTGSCAREPEQPFA